MHIKSVDASVERRILIGLIISDEFIKEIQEIIKLKYFQNSAARLVAKWCLDFYKDYGQAPKSQIQQIYEDRREELDEVVDEFILDLLHTISEEYDTDLADDFNAKFHIERAVKYFKRRELQMLTDDLETALEGGKVELAEELIYKFKPVERETEECFDPFADDDVILSSFNAIGEPLFRLPGALGVLLNTQLYRASFIGFQGAEKVGKTWFLQELMIRALRCRRRVAFFEAGDLTKEQRMCRLYSRLAGKPWVPGKHEGMTRVSVPVFPDDELDEFEVDEVEVEVLTPHDAIQARKRWERRAAGRCRMSVHTNTTLTVRQIDEMLEKWEGKQGFVPDVIIVDYADILAPEDKRIEDRHTINATWKALRALSQKWNACVITATQADADAYVRGTQTLKNYSEDKRKYSHVTAMFALNKSQGEREYGFVLRVNELMVREGAIVSGKKQVAVVGNPAKAQPWYRIFFTNKPLA